ncbi:MAG: hypothetical protein RBR38_12160 [Desulfomicrobium apsheronum]|nr:hypothetical protein [Desulfomicrobium apsheronum]
MQNDGSSSFDVELTDLNQFGQPSLRRTAMQAEELAAFRIADHYWESLSFFSFLLA